MLINAYDFMKLSYLQEAANAVCGSIEDKKTFTTYASELNRLMKYADRDDITSHTRKQYEAINAIYAELQKKRKHTNTTDLMIEINRIISDYVEIELTPTTVREKTRRFDISAIDFDLLRREFAKVKKKNLILKDLEEVIQNKLDSMLFANPNRINYYERYQQIIDDYNSEKNRATIEKTFMELMDLANNMSQEEQRYVREGFKSDEELSFYDMLFRDDLSKTDIKKLKEVTISLIQKIKTKIAEFDHWTDKQETKAAINNLIRDTLWKELPVCYDEVSISMYRQNIYEYVYTRYR
ncbi:type I restriction enzyme endonuclease domain-containing protein [uncultured Finegoldia sp.]|uniref:type I restriction enzyme endonuclease domain-containing protein n=1 Tax=uncultured Finegoldia sp. TaxID=328009 RepID=UPI00344146B8